MADRLEALSELLDVVDRLRGPQGCAWDRDQTLSSLRPYMLEEAYEVADSIQDGDWHALRGELGDLLLHVLMMAAIAGERGLFDVSDVAGSIRDKLVRRHPHVFGDGDQLTPEQVERQWESIKASEKRLEGFFDSIPSSMPALQLAWRIQQRASEVGFDWPVPEGARYKLMEELEEFEESLESESSCRQEEELGDLLFSLVNYCRLSGFEPEQALRRANRKFMCRFYLMEKGLRQKGLSLRDASLEEMEEEWRRAKETAEPPDEGGNS
ncbi:nucleoside triphosphate pyrophosphohydrolase [Candidatus Fermentibacteria bacterium]|nr:nucleoside triphosphate pyrophosphohydrolase [Candidatus Fermentibacteria bacterium]